ncbi:hypothetical protein Anapl_18735 [Anas platyrhynchos]|uniref:Uncharacterized protein n=1 Tax=Anas platyrhynchos TaxID=8839 RepID=R0KXC8_ANAPL|nr:hypothetical protein Anapl_18735 [Anas platyrhynchos]
MLAEVTENLTRVSSEYDTLLAEKEQAERRMKEHVCPEPEKVAVLNQEKEELQQMINALSEDLNLVTKERQQLLGELKEKTESENKDNELQQLEKRCAVLAWERDEFEELLEAVQAEKNKLEVNLQKSVDKVLYLLIKVEQR